MDKERKIEEIAKKIEEMGVSKKSARHYAELEVNENKAYLAAFRFVRPLNKDLEKYEKGYKSWEDIKRIPGVSGLKDSGANLEDVLKLIHDTMFTCYGGVLYRLSDPAGWDFDLEECGEYLPGWALWENEPYMG